MNRKTAVGFGDEPLFRESSVLSFVTRVVGNPPLPGDQSIPGKIALPGQGAQPGQHLPDMNAAELGDIAVAAIAAWRDRCQGSVENGAHFILGLSAVSILHC